MVKSLLLCVFLWYLSVAVPAASPNDSLHNLTVRSSGIERIDALVKLAALYKDQDSMLMARKTYQDAFTALQALHRSDRKTQSLEIRIRLGLAYINLFQSAEYHQSLDLLLTALEMARQVNDSSALAECCVYLGFNYRFLSKYTKALEFLDESIMMSSAVGDTGFLIAALNEKANVYFFLKDTVQCRNLHLQALDYAIKTNNRYARSYISHDLAFLFMDAGNYRKALAYFLVNYNYSREIQEKREISIAAENVAETYILLNRPDSALYYLTIADTITRRHDLVYERSLVLLSYSEAYSLRNDYRNAFEYLRQYMNLSDTIFSIEKEKQINEITTRYETDKKEQENRILRQQYQTTILIVAIVAGFVIIIILLLLRINRKKVIHNRELETRNEVIRRQKDNLAMAFDILSKRENELAEANSAKDIFFSIIAHDLKNPFNTLLGFTNFLRSDYKSLSEQEVASVIVSINESALALYKLLENLLEWTRTQTKRIQVNPESFDLTTLIRNNIGISQATANTKHITIHFHHDPPLMVFADPGMIDFVIRNLLSNALKYVRTGGEITISLQRKSGSVIVQVKDNGVGIPGDNLQKLFRIDGKVKTPGTADERGTGLGLIICKEFVEMNHGKIWVESVEDNGSIFFFSIPL